MRGRVEQPLAQRHRAIDVDDDGNAAPARLGAEIGAEFRAAALGQDRGAIVQQRLGVGQLTFHSSGSRKVTMVRSPLGSTMMAEIGVTRPGMCTR